MKKMLLLALLYLISFQSNAAEENSGFSRINDSTFVETRVGDQRLTKTKYRWISRGIEYSIYINRKNGHCYIIKTSKKTGKEYKSSINIAASKIVAKELNITYIEHKK